MERSGARVSWNVKAALDDKAGRSPQVEIYADHAATWLAPVAGAKRFGQNI